MPDSMIEVETSTSASPRRKAIMRSSSCFSSICPWATVNVSFGHSERSRSAVSSMSSTRLCRKNAWPSRATSRSSACLTSCSSYSPT